MFFAKRGLTNKSPYAILITEREVRKMIITCKTYSDLKLAIIHKIADFDEYISEVKITYDSKKNIWVAEFEINDNFRDIE